MVSPLINFNGSPRGVDEMYFAKIAEFKQREIIMKYFSLPLSSLRLVITQVTTVSSLWGCGELFVELPTLNSESNQESSLEVTLSLV